MWWDTRAGMLWLVGIPISRVPKSHDCCCSCCSCPCSSSGRTTTPLVETITIARVSAGDDRELWLSESCRGVESNGMCLYGPEQTRIKCVRVPLFGTQRNCSLFYNRLRDAHSTIYFVRSIIVIAGGPPPPPQTNRSRERHYTTRNKQECVVGVF